METNTETKPVTTECPDCGEVHRDGEWCADDDNEQVDFNHDRAWVG